MRLPAAFALLTLLVAHQAQAAAPAVSHAENAVEISVGTMHTQYHENAPEGTGDDETGYQPGAGLSASVLLPVLRGWEVSDLYADVNYNVFAGDIGYFGHYFNSPEPADKTDSASFNRVEARIGLGLPLSDGIEVIPFIAGGFQDWNRNDLLDATHTMVEFYHSGLIGGGLRLDVPLTPGLVASADAELLAMVRGGLVAPQAGFDSGFGASGQQRIDLSLSQALFWNFRLVTSAFWQHFVYSGTKEVLTPVGGRHEPLSVTTQFGGELGLGYSFY